MEKTGSYGKDGHAVMEKTGSYGKDRHLWKRRALMEKTGIKHLKARFFTHRAQPVLHIITRHTKHLSASLGRTEKRIIDLSNIPNVRL